MKVLVCGDRHWGEIEVDENVWVPDPNKIDEMYLNTHLDALHLEKNFTVLIEGEARGADRMSAAWARAKGVIVEAYPAEWHRWGHAAGPIRNKQMLVEGKPELVIAFHRNIEKSKGTKNMVALAQKAGVMTIVLGDYLRQQQELFPEVYEKRKW